MSFLCLRIGPVQLLQLYPYALFCVCFFCPLSFIIIDGLYTTNNYIIQLTFFIDSEEVSRFSAEPVKAATVLCIRSMIFLSIRVSLRSSLEARWCTYPKFTRVIKSTVQITSRSGTSVNVRSMTESGLHTWQSIRLNKPTRVYGLQICPKPLLTRSV